MYMYMYNVHYTPVNVNHMSKSLFQLDGLAIIENTLDEDWNEVNLTRALTTISDR